MNFLCKEENTEKIVLKKNKKVRFYPVILVSLIPFYTDYFSVSEIWYTKNDCEIFQSCYFEILKSLMERHRIDVKLAKKILNKTRIEYDENCFTEYLEER
jgi:hypothetical protein